MKMTFYSEVRRTGRYRYRRGWFGKIHLQVEAVLTVDDFTGPERNYNQEGGQNYWRDATWDDFKTIAGGLEAYKKDMYVGDKFDAHPAYPLTGFRWFAKHPFITRMPALRIQYGITEVVDGSGLIRVTGRASRWANKNDVELLSPFQFEKNHKGVSEKYDEDD